MGQTVRVRTDVTGPWPDVEPGPIVILGGRSEIGLQTALRLAEATADDPREFVLAARPDRDLGDERARLQAAGARAVHQVVFDADAVAGHPAFFDGLVERYGTPAIWVLSFGLLGDQARAETDSAHAVQIVHTDYVAQVAALTEIAHRARAAGTGRIVVFSSVAGVRVRRANYVYGSAKAGLDGFATGLSDALTGSGVHLLVVRPGFVIGRMTEGMDPAPLSSTPDQVAAAVVEALRRGRRTVWVPGALRWLFAIARIVPGPVWRRLPR